MVDGHMNIERIVKQFEDVFELKLQEGGLLLDGEGDLPKSMGYFFTDRNGENSNMAIVTNEYSSGTRRVRFVYLDATSSSRDVGVYPYIQLICESQEWLRKELMKMKMEWVLLR